MDVSTGKTVATYNWETKGFMCPSLAPLWKKGRSKAWAVKFLADHGFEMQSSKRKRTQCPDRKAGLLTGDAHGICRSYVSVHAVAPRTPSPLIAQLADAKPAAPAMTAAMASMGAAAMTPGAMNAPAKATLASPAKAPAKEAMAGGKKKASGKKKGCGCRQGSPAAFPALVLMGLAIAWLTRRRTRQG